MKVTDDWQLLAVRLLGVAEMTLAIAPEAQLLHVAVASVRSGVRDEVAVLGVQ